MQMYMHERNQFGYDANASKEVSRCACTFGAPFQDGPSVCACVCISYR